MNSEDPPEGSEQDVNQGTSSSSSPHVIYSYSSSELRKRNATVREDMRNHQRKETSSSANSKASSGDTHQSSGFECNICFDTASEPVISLCGHLYCWPCIYPWIESNTSPLCPVCKGGIGTDKLIPVYARGKEAKDPR